MVQTPIKPQTSERQEVINWLVANNYPALPECDRFIKWLGKSELAKIEGGQA